MVFTGGSAESTAPPGSLPFSLPAWIPHPFLPEKPHALPETFHLFSFMLHCSLNKDMNMQSDATRQQELTQRQGREALGKAGDTPSNNSIPKAPPAHPHPLPPTGTDSGASPCSRTAG